MAIYRAFLPAIRIGKNIKKTKFHFTAMAVKGKNVRSVAKHLKRKGFLGVDTKQIEKVARKDFMGTNWSSRFNKISSKKWNKMQKKEHGFIPRKTTGNKYFVKTEGVSATKPKKMIFFKQGKV
jgi:hypothetical protein|tara:strand:+ start:217 stop:585 length:369 start_codon:yes stop_codon:yes gene_type:complete